MSGRLCFSLALAICSCSGAHTAKGDSEFIAAKLHVVRSLPTPLSCSLKGLSLADSAELQVAHRIE